MFTQLAEFEVILAEVVTPLRDAVRLVDRDQTHLGARQHFHRAGLQQAFRSDIEQIDFSGRNRAGDARLVIRAQARIQKCGGDAELLERSNLLLRQGDQRGHDGRDSGAQRRGDLVAHRFTSPGGHRHMAVLAPVAVVD